MIKIILFLVLILALLVVLTYFGLNNYIVLNGYTVYISFVYILAYVIYFIVGSGKQEQKELKFIEKILFNIDYYVKKYNTIASMYYFFAALISIVFLFILFNIIFYYIFGYILDYTVLFENKVFIWLFLFVYLVIATALLIDGIRYNIAVVSLFSVFLLFFPFLLYFLKFSFYKHTAINLDNIIGNYLIYVLIMFFVIVQIFLYKIAYFYQKKASDYEESLFYVKILKDYIQLENLEKNNINDIFNDTTFINKLEFEKIKDKFLKLDLT